MFHPPPRQPLPHGGDSPSTQCQGTDPLSAVNVNTLPKSCLCPRALYPDYRHTLPAPSGGGGRRRGTRRAAGVVDVNRSTGDTQATWEGGAVSASPLPVSPSPRGDSPSTQCQGTDPLSAVSVNTLAEIPFMLPGALYPGQSPYTARPL